MYLFPILLFFLWIKILKFLVSYSRALHYDLTTNDMFSSGIVFVLISNKYSTFNIISLYFYRHLPGGPIYWRSMQRNFGHCSQWIWILHWRLNHKTPGIVFLFSNCLIISSEMTVSTCIFFSIWMGRGGANAVCVNVYSQSPRTCSANQHR